MSAVDGQVSQNSDETFGTLISSAVENTQSGNSVEGSLLSDEQLTDNYFYEHEKARSQSISLILDHYERAYNQKAIFQNRYRVILFWGCSVIVIAFTFAVLYALIFTIYSASTLNLKGLTGTITAMISLVVSILKLVETITKYCFPENDDQYIIKIVDSVQNTDLKRMMEVNRSEEVRGNIANSKQSHQNIPDNT